MHLEKNALDLHKLIADKDGLNFTLSVIVVVR